MKGSLNKFLRLNDTGEADDLDLELAASCEQYLHQRIEFSPASSRDTYLERLKEIYEPLNKAFVPKTTLKRKMQVESEPTTGLERDSPGKRPTSESNSPVDDIPKPRQVLFSPERVDLNWRISKSVGLGLRNVGNTCFLNSVLQCLTYTPPLVNYLNAGEHKRICAVTGFCAMCELQNHIGRVFGSPGVAVRPVQIVQNIKNIAKHFKFGRQEDAHEFLRYFVDAMQKACLHRFPAKLEPYSKHTTIIHQIFGGYHRSQVKCLHCMKTSNTYDPLLDISLDIKGCTSLTKALQKSIKADMLDGDNKYACPFCKKMTKAHKRFTIHKLPNVLTIQLKRFEYNSLFGGKLNKGVMYPEHLDVRPYMSNPQGESEWYRLYAVLVHLGISCHSGHYYCYVNGANKVWYCLNDAQVQQVSLETALSQEAYLLFYIRDSNFKLPPPPPTLPRMGPLLPPKATSSVAHSPFARKPQETSPAPPVPPAPAAASASTDALPNMAELSMGVPVQRPKKTKPLGPTHPQTKPTGVVNPSLKVPLSSEPHSPKMDLSMMAPPPPPPPPPPAPVAKQPPVAGSSAEDSFELRKSVPAPPKQVVPPISPSSVKPPPPPLVQPAFVPRALKLSNKAPPSSKPSFPSPTVASSGTNKLFPSASSTLKKEVKSEKSDSSAASDSVLLSEPPVSSSQAIPSVGSEVSSPKVARVQPQPHKIFRPVARVPPSPQAASKDILAPSREKASSGGNGKTHFGPVLPSSIGGEGASRVGSSSSQWRASTSDLPGEPCSDRSLPESEYSPGWVATPVKKAPATAAQGDAPPTAGMGTKIVFKKSQNWVPHRHQKQHHRKVLAGDSDLESDEEGLFFIKPKKATESPAKTTTGSEKSSKSRLSAPAEKDHSSSHRHQEGGAHKQHYHHQSRRRSSSESTSSTATTSSTEEEDQHSRRRKRHRHRSSSSSSSCSSESDEYRSSKRARREHRRARRRHSSEDGRHHHRRHRHGHRHSSPPRSRPGYDSDDSSTSGSSVAPQKKSWRTDHHRSSRRWSESRRYESDSDRSRSPKRRKDRHSSHHHHHLHHHQRKSTPQRKEHHHHHKLSSLSGHKKAGPSCSSSGSRHEGKGRDKHHHRDSSERDVDRHQSKRDVKRGDSVAVCGDSKSSSGGQAHKTASSLTTMSLPAILTKSSHSGLGESVKTWSGKRNSIDTSRLEGEGVFAGRDEWDKEIDKGKVKKAKKHHDSEWNSKNLFQEHQSKKNREFKAKV